MGLSSFAFPEPCTCYEYHFGRRHIRTPQTQLQPFAPVRMSSRRLQRKAESRATEPTSKTRRNGMHASPHTECLPTCKNPRTPPPFPGGRSSGNHDRLRAGRTKVSCGNCWKCVRIGRSIRRSSTRRNAPWHQPSLLRCTQLSVWRRGRNHLSARWGLKNKGCGLGARLREPVQPASDHRRDATVRAHLPPVGWWRAVCSRRCIPERHTAPTAT